MYFAAFAVVALIAWAADRCRGALRVVLLTASTTPLLALAALRETTVGTDVMSYALYECDYAAAQSFAEYFPRALTTHGLGFTLVSWMTCHLSGGQLQLLLFALQALTVAPVIITLARLTRSATWVGMLIYCLVLFPFSLNGMKQAIAAAFICAAVIPALRRSPRGFLLLVVLGVVFHQTAIIGLAVYPALHLMEASNSARAFFGRYQMPILIVAVIAALGIVRVYGAELVSLLAFLKDSYAYQVDHLGQGDVNLAFGALLLALVVLSAWFRLSREREPLPDIATALVAGAGVNRLPLNLTVITGMGCLLGQLDTISATLGRLGWYGIVFLPVVAVAHGQYSKKRGFNGALLLVCLAFFVTRTMWLGMDQIYPYVFAVN